MSKFSIKLFVIFGIICSQLACVGNGDASLRAKICETEQDIPSGYFGKYIFSAPKFLPSQNNFMTMQSFPFEIKAEDDGVFAMLPRNIVSTFVSDPDKFPFNGKLKVCTIDGISYFQTLNDDGTYGISRVEYGVSSLEPSAQNPQSQPRQTITMAPLTFNPELIKIYNRNNSKPIPFTILPSFSIDEAKEGEIKSNLGDHPTRMIIDNRDFVSPEDKALLLSKAIPSNMGVWLFVKLPPEESALAKKGESLVKIRL